MARSTRRHAREPGTFSRWLAGALLLWAGGASASDIEIRSASAEIVNDMFVINAEASFEFSDDALKALRSGVAIVIDLDVRLTRHRKYLWDPEVFRTRRRYSLERHALSEQFILSDIITGDRRIHPSLELAIRDLGRVRALPITEFSTLRDKRPIDVGIRFRLDIASLPAPMIPLAYLSRGWHMSSGWHRWTTDL